MLTETSNWRASVIRYSLLALAGVLGSCVMIRLLYVRSLNYDELSHAHMAWLVSVGEIPYRDFAINHFPFFWAPLSFLIRVLPHDSRAMGYLRVLALLLNVIFIGGLGTIISRGRPANERGWAFAALGLVVFSPPAMHFLIEFRPDALANALLFSGLAWYTVRGWQCIPASMVCGFLIAAAVLINTKYVLFPFVLGAAALFCHLLRTPRVWPTALAICAGVFLAIGSGAILLSAMHISFSDAWRMAVSYNAMAEKAHTFGYGMALAVMEHPLLLAYVFTGLLCYFTPFVRTRLSQDVFGVAILIFLILNLATSTRPWKQYFVSWFLLAAYFPARSFALLASRLGAWYQAGLALGFLATVFAGLTTLRVADPSGGGEDHASQNRLIDWAGQTLPSDSFVAAGFPMHPLFFRDSFYKVVVDMTSTTADGLEEFMPDISGKVEKEHFQFAGYSRELEIHPPAMIVFWGVYTATQADALNEYIKRHPDRYARQLIPNSSLTVLIRRSPGAPTQ